MAERSIYPVDAAERLRARTGKPYRPSNGSEGEYFEHLWCANCRLCEVRGEPCEIRLNAFFLGIHEPQYPREWVYGSEGQPECTAFQDKRTPRQVPRCKATADLFADLVNPPANTPGA